MEAPEETPEGTIWERVAKDKSARLRGEGPFARARRRLRGVRQRVGKVGQRIKQIIRPLEVLQFVAALFLNVTFAATFGFVGDTFSLPQHAWVLAKSFERWVEPFSSVRRNGKRGKEGNAGDDERTRERRRRTGWVPSPPLSSRRGSRTPSAGAGRLSGACDDPLARRKTSAGISSGRWSISPRRGIDSTASATARVPWIASDARWRIRPNDPDLLVCLSKSLSTRCSRRTSSTTTPSRVRCPRKLRRFPNAQSP